MSWDLGSGSKGQGRTSKGPPLSLLGKFKGHYAFVEDTVSSRKVPKHFSPATLFEPSAFCQNKDQNKPSKPQRPQAPQPPQP